MDNSKSIYVTRHIFDVGQKNGKNEGGYYIGTSTINVLDHAASQLPCERDPDSIIYATLGEACYDLHEERRKISSILGRENMEYFSITQYGFHVTDQNEHLFDEVKIKKIW